MAERLPTVDRVEKVAPGTGEVVLTTDAKKPGGTWTITEISVLNEDNTGSGVDISLVDGLSEYEWQSVRALVEGATKHLPLEFTCPSQYRVRARFNDHTTGDTLVLVVLGYVDY